MFEDAAKASLDNFQGLFDRDDNESVPIDHFIDELNLRYTMGNVSSREGSLLDITTTFNIARWHVYKRTGEADRLLILSTSGDLYDSVLGFVSPILSIATMVDFSLITVNNRAYITPHDRNRGIPSQKVYVYQGSGTARAAAGVAPSGFTLGVALSGTSGVMEAGDRLYGVIFESDSGYLSKPGPATFTQFTSTTGSALDFSAVPVGPSGTIARHIVCTKALDLDTYNGDQMSIEYFFLPNGRGTIPNNTDTTLNAVSFYDSELIASADYLFDQLPEIPAGVGIGTYASSLIVWGSNAAPGTIYVSKANEPESFDGVDGLIIIRDDGAGSLKNCTEFRKQLIIKKSRRTYITSDNGDVPSTWSVDTLDQGVGTECFGVGRLYDEQGALLENFLVADYGALRLFDGTFRNELSWKIEKRWKRINKAAFSTVQVSIDSVNKTIYIAVPLDNATAPSHIIVGDFTNGLDAKLIKWGTWSLPIAPNSIGLMINDTTKKVVLKISGAGQNVYKMAEDELDDFGTAFSYHYRTAYIYYGDGEEQNQYIGISKRVTGIGDLQVDIYGLDDVESESPGNMTLSATSAKSIVLPLNFVSEKASFKFTGGFNNGDYFELGSMKIFGAVIWNEVPL